MKTLWKVFFIFTAILLSISVFFMVFINKRNGTDWQLEPIFAGLRLALLFPLFGFVYNKRILIPGLWRVLVFVQLAACLTDLVIDINSWTDYSDEVVLMKKIGMGTILVSALPVWYAVFRYSSSLHPVWHKNDTEPKKSNQI